MACNSIISDENIKEAFNTDNIKASFMKATYCERDDIKTAFIDIEKNGKKLLEHCCIHKEYIKDIDYKFVKLQGIRIKTNLRNSGISKKIIKRNIKIYRKENFKCIKLNAIQDGMIVWSKLGFKFDNIKDERTILRYFRDYLNEIKKIKNKGYTSIKSIDSSDFFDSKINFTDWLSENTKLYGLPMTMEL